MPLYYYENMKLVHYSNALLLLSIYLGIHGRISRPIGGPRRYRGNK